MRKHLYLITEHDHNDDLVGSVEFAETRLDSAEKNVETPMHVFDKETGDFATVGKRVGLGYVDIAGDGELTGEEAAAVAQSKLAEIDERHLEKAGVELEALADG